MLEAKPRKHFLAVLLLVTALLSITIAIIPIPQVSAVDTLIDYYGTANQNDYYGPWTLAMSSGCCRGQSFTNLAAPYKITSVILYLRRGGSPSGTAYVKLYAHDGTYGSSSVPTGSALASSVGFNVSTLTTSYKNYTFAFNATNQYAMAANIHYTIVFGFITSGTEDGNNYPRLGIDSSSPTHGGNSFSWNGGNWAAEAYDVIFYVYGTAVQLATTTSDQLTSIAGQMTTTTTTTPVNVIVHGGTTIKVTTTVMSNASVTQFTTTTVPNTTSLTTTTTSNYQVTTGNSVTRTMTTVTSTLAGGSSIVGTSTSTTTSGRTNIIQIIYAQNSTQIVSSYLRVANPLVNQNVTYYQLKILIILSGSAKQIGAVLRVLYRNVGQVLGVNKANAHVVLGVDPMTTSQLDAYPVWMFYSYLITVIIEIIVSFLLLACRHRQR